jgi:hypothetical protein
MKRLLFFLTLITAALLATAPVKACECICKQFGDGSPIAMRQHAAAVFVGEVLAVTEFKDVKGMVGVEVNFRVERYWKGVKQPEMTIRMNWACCDKPHPRIGDKYLVYAVGKKRETTCTRTNQLDLADEDLRTLGPGKTFEQTNAPARTGHSD